jgi:hypothetical protein
MPHVLTASMQVIESRHEPLCGSALTLLARPAMSSRRASEENFIVYEYWVSGCGRMVSDELLSVAGLSLAS